MVLFLVFVDLSLRLDVSNRLHFSIVLLGLRNVVIEGCFIIGVGGVISSMDLLFFFDVS